MHYILPFYGIEDDPDDTEIIKEACNKVGVTDYEFFAEDKEFFAVFNDHIPVIVLDYNLPDTNGQAVLDRARRINPTVRAILISGIITEEMAARLSVAGAKDFVVKRGSAWAIELAQKIKYQLQLATEDIKDKLNFRSEIKNLLKK